MSHSLKLNALALIVSKEYDDILNKTPERFKEALDNVTVRTLWDHPNKDRLGEYCGVPLPSWHPYSQGHLSPEIVIFARPIIQMCEDDEAVIKKIRKVLLHEIGHHLGLSEKDLRDRGIY